MTNDGLGNETRLRADFPIDVVHTTGLDDSGFAWLTEPIDGERSVDDSRVPQVLPDSLPITETTIGKPTDSGYKLYQATRRERVDIAIEAIACVLLPMLLVFGVMAAVIVLL